MLCHFNLKTQDHNYSHTIAVQTAFYSTKERLLQYLHTPLWHFTLPVKALKQVWAAELHFIREQILFLSASRAVNKPDGLLSL